MEVRLITRATMDLIASNHVSNHLQVVAVELRLTMNTERPFDHELKHPHFLLHSGRSYLLAFGAEGRSSDLAATSPSLLIHSARQGTFQPEAVPGA